MTMRFEQTFACMTLLTLAATCASAQGPLDPVGAPGVTMKTLRQLEPRTPISSAPYTITSPGAYYLTTNLVSTGHGLVVQADHVSVDLMGFSITGDGGSADYGIFFDGDSTRHVRDVRVHNGTIERFYYGIRMEFARQNRLDDLRVAKCTSTGVLLLGTGGSLCSGNRIASCSISENEGFGIYLAGNAGAVDGNIIEDCSISENNNTGINLFGSGGSCSGNRVQNCVIRANKNYGLGYTAASNNVVTASSLCGQTSYGVYMTSSCANNAIQDCLIAQNGNDGIYCSGGSGNRFERNLISDNTAAGINSTSPKSLILRNVCIGNAANFSFGSTETYGPLVTDTGSLPTTGAAAHPWANFSRP